jgi:hypothetical protein
MAMNINHMYQFLIVALLLISSPSRAAESHACLPIQEVLINGLFPTQPSEKLKKLPKPLKKTYGFGEDDGGTYKGTTFEYSNYKLEVVRGLIDSITITSPEQEWYKGITVGMSRNKIKQLIGSSPVAEGKNQDQYITCESTADVYAILDYENNQLKTITLIMDRP